jgi:hypothetical protein
MTPRSLPPPFYVQPFYVQPSYVQPSYVQPFYVQVMAGRQNGFQVGCDVNFR